MNWRYNNSLVALQNIHNSIWNLIGPFDGGPAPVLKKNSSKKHTCSQDRNDKTLTRIVPWIFRDEKFCAQYSLHNLASLYISLTYWRKVATSMGLMIPNVWTMDFTQPSTWFPVSHSGSTALHCTLLCKAGLLLIVKSWTHTNFPSSLLRQFGSYTRPPVSFQDAAEQGWIISRKVFFKKSRPLWQGYGVAAYADMLCLIAYFVLLGLGVFSVQNPIWISVRIVRPMSGLLPPELRQCGWRKFVCYCYTGYPPQIVACQQTRLVETFFFSGWKTTRSTNLPACGKI